MNRSSARKKAPPRKDGTKYQSVLQATRELVDESGFRNVSLKAIATRAGVSRNVLYNWWDGDLQCIIEEAILPDVSTWPTPDTGSLKGDLTEFIELSIELLHKPNVLAGYLQLASHVVDRPEDLQRTSKKFRVPYARLLGRIMQKAEQRGELRPRDNDDNLHHSVLAQMISGCVLQFAITKKPGRRKSRAILVNSIIKLLA